MPNGAPAAQDLLSPLERAWLAEHPRVRLAPTPDYAPTEFLDEGGAYRGITADVMELVEQRTGLRFEVVRRAPDELVLGTPEAMRVDVVPLSHENETRREHWRFTTPYLHYPAFILVRRGRAGELTTADLAGLDVVVVQGYAAAEHLRRSVPGIRLSEVRDNVTALRMVSFGAVDALVTELPVATHAIEREGITNLRVGGRTDFVYSMGISSRRDWPELASILQKGLDAVSADELEAIYRRWVRWDEPPAGPRFALWIALVGAGLGLAATLLWIRTLARRVASRTQALEHELAERERAEQERARLEAELNQAQRLDSLGTIAGGIAHDFNNILLSIYGYGELALVNLPPDSPAREALEQVLQASDRAKSLIQQILTFSRESRLERVPVDLGAVVAEALRLLRPTLPAGLRVAERIDPGVPPVHADAAQMHQVAANLITNAVHALEGGGARDELEVRVEAFDLGPGLALSLGELVPGRYVRLSVRDTGAGIDPAVRPRIFDPFFTTKDVGKGTGLGLSVVHGIVRGHDGAVEVTSEAGVGTRFDVYLPAHPRAADAPPPPAAGPLVGTEHVLLVDDERPLVQLMRSQLEGADYRVTTCGSAAAALELLERDPRSVDLLLTDKQMPQLDGLELAYRAHALRPDLPIVLSTGLPHTVAAGDLRATGIVAVLAKPHSAAELLDAVRHALDAATAGR